MPLLKFINIGKKHINAEIIIFASIPIPNIKIIKGANVITGIICDTIIIGIIVSKNFLKYNPMTITRKLKNVAKIKPKRDSINVIQDAFINELKLSIKYWNDNDGVDTRSLVVLLFLPANSQTNSMTNNRTI